MNTQVNETALRAPDLTAHAPRSPRCRLGGYAILPRLLDKCRADLAGMIGEYHTNCPIDQEFLAFAGIDYVALREQLATGVSDSQALLWIEENATKRCSPWEIEQWSEYQNRRSPQPHSESADYFLSVLASHNKDRADVRSWADLLDLDDYCSFGGAA